MALTRAPGQHVGEVEDSNICDTPTMAEVEDADTVTIKTFADTKHALGANKSSLTSAQRKVKSNIRGFF